MGNIVNPGAADITFVDDFGDFVAGPSITFFTLDFTALQVTTSPTTVGVALGSFGAFGDPFFDEYTIDNFNGAQVSVNPRVPVPAAVWLFGSGLIGLIGVARRPTKTAITA